MKEKDLDEIIEKMNKMIDDMGKREDFEKFKKEHENKSLEELLDELKEKVTENLKPEYELAIKSNEDGKSHQTTIVGELNSIMFGLAELIADMVKNCKIPKEIVRKTVAIGLGDEEE